jgi:nitrite reductase/ring-hydroxylating ferredoxin subunit
VSSAVHEDVPREPYRLVVEPGESVVRAGSLAELFGLGDRAVLLVVLGSAEPEELLLLRFRHGLFALVNRCPHLGRPLDDGQVRGHTLQCRGHGRSYSLRTGRPAGTLAWGGPPKLRRVPAWAEDGYLYLDLTPLA